VPLHGQTAVRRNLLRRRLREIVRTRLLPELGALDLVVRARPAAYRCSFHELAVELETWARTHTG
jgi:ribonuclease P protein component